MTPIDDDLVPGLEELLELVGPLRLRNCPLTPTPRQEAFLRLTCPEALFGGAAGGGKSIALLMSAAQYIDVPGYHALLLRTTLSELEHPGGLLDLAHEWFGPTKASWSGEQRAWRFPAGTRSGAGGASIRFGYLDGQRDVGRYAGSSFSFLGFDELSQVDEISYRRMFRVLRQASTGPGLDRAPDGLTLADVPVRTRATSNPGGPNHGWIKQRFVDPQTRETGVVFLPSRWRDNPHLDLDAYQKRLAHLPPVERKRLIEGDWDVADEGEMFRREWFEPVKRTDRPRTHAQGPLLGLRLQPAHPRQPGPRLHGRAPYSSSTTRPGSTTSPGSSASAAMPDRSNSSFSQLPKPTETTSRSTSNRNPPPTASS